MSSSPGSLSTNKQVSTISGQSVYDFGKKSTISENKVHKSKKNRACGGPNLIHFSLYKVHKPQNFRACGGPNPIHFLLYRAYKPYNFCTRGGQNPMHCHLDCIQGSALARRRRENFGDCGFCTREKNWDLVFLYKGEYIEFSPPQARFFWILRAYFQKS